jgi:ribosomal protein S18 acetylase RimI-like enzyme
MTCYPDTPEDRWIVEWVATVPEFRGRGIVNQLLLAILDKGRERGFEKAQIGYLLGNTRAQRSYERVGFKTVSDRRDPDFEAALDCPGIACMHLDL